MFGVIGGSGIYEIDQLKIKEEREVKTPFGYPSSRIILGELEGKEVAFLPRHGKTHTLPPSAINFRANIYALKSVGVTRILSISAVGSMKEHIRPGDVVIPDQFIDKTTARERTFFDNGIVVHVGFAKPVCPELCDVLEKASKEDGVTTHRDGIYLCIEGPQFSTKAESLIYRSWGVDVIGMTNLPEARLAREAEICYATLAFPTDYDCWYEGEEVVTAQMVLNTLNKNVKKAKNILKRVLKYISEERNCPCKDALKDSIVTAKENIPFEVKERLKIIIGRYI